MVPTVPTAFSIANDEASADYPEFDPFPDFDCEWPTTSESAHSQGLTIPDIPLDFNPSPGSVSTWQFLLDLVAAGRSDVPSKLLLNDNPADDFLIEVDSVPSALFPTNENPETNFPTLHFPIIDNFPVAGYAAPPSVARTRARRAKNPKHLTESDRIEYLHSDEWVADFNVTWVLCGICANKIKLDDRDGARYYLQNWRKHKDACSKRRGKKIAQEKRSGGFFLSSDMII